MRQYCSLVRYLRITFSAMFLTVLVTGLHLERGHRRQVSKECCDLKGGFQCGNFETDCCAVPQDTPPDQISSSLCTHSGLFDSFQNCPGPTITQQCSYCHNYCSSLNGIMCGLSATGQDSCCSRQNCILNIQLNLRMKKCKPGTEIKLPDCVNDMNFIDQAFGLLENIG